MAKSAIHYYFATMEEIVDRAMAGHIQGFVDRLRGVGARHEDPTDRFWAVVRDYLDCFDEQPSIAPLWFGYWVAALEAGRLEPCHQR